MRTILRGLIGIALLWAPTAAAQNPIERFRPDSIGEEVVFSSGENRLSGSLLLPDGPGPHPVVVYLEGSGAYSYRRYWQSDWFSFAPGIAQALLDEGVAVLFYDKPGVNRSTGDWRLQSFEDRAVEALHAVEYLRTRPEIDSTRIGLLGHSQGGRIAYLAASRAPRRVAFLVSLAGGTVSVREQILDDMRGDWTCAGVSRPSMAIRSAAVWTWLQGVSLVSRVARPSYQSRIIRSTPRPHLERVTQPALVLFGANDRLVPIEKNRGSLTHHFGRRTGNDELRVHVIPGADHSFRLSPICRGEQPLPQAFAPGFREALTDPVFWRMVRSSR